MKQNTMHESLAQRGFSPVASSARSCEKTQYCLWRRGAERLLLVSGEPDVSLAGEKKSLYGESWIECALTHDNCVALQKRFPYMAPTSLHGRAVTIGLGDRLGLLSGAHIAALAGTQAFPVLAQQSKRELSLTGRSYRQMLDDVAWQVFEAGYEGGYGADGDHLKTMEDVCDAIADGATMITLDCSDYIDSQARTLSPDEADAKCRSCFPHSQIEQWHNEYCGKEMTLQSGHHVYFSPETFSQLLLTYGSAVSFMDKVYRQAIATAPHSVSFEISIDETDVPTTPEAHYFIAKQLAQRNVRADSVAPRFCGEFQKGIDYIGSTEQFAAEFAVHAAIAHEFGYRISVHSGSDKFSIFPYVGKLSGYRFHLKTSGTSWVEAVRVIAMCNPALLRRMVAFSCEHFEEAKTYYHVSASAARVPDLSKIPDDKLAELLDETDTRQVMHITYGFLLQAKQETGAYAFRDEIYQTLCENKVLLDCVIEKHIRRHLESLGLFAD